MHMLLILSDGPIIVYASVIETQNYGGIKMLINLFITYAADVFMNIAEAASSLSSNVLWNEPKCPDELLK